MNLIALICVSLFLLGAAFVSTGPAPLRDAAGEHESLGSSTADMYTLAIIAPESFADGLQPLVEHKQSHGCSTIFRTIESIVSSYDGRDDAEKLKYYLKGAVEDYNISYALLVGGRKPLSTEWYMPVRYSHVVDGTQYEEFLSDLYFADIYDEDGFFEDWDSNGNGIFGEFSPAGMDDVDLIPDVAIGRLPCRTQREVSIIVEKIITYENTAFGMHWSRRLVAIGGNTFPQVDTGDFPYEGEATCDLVCDLMGDFDVVKLYTSDGSLTGSQDIIDTINQGCGFVMTRGRGGTDRVRMVTADGEEFIAFRNLNVPLLHNAGECPIIVLGECIHGKFDVGIYNVLDRFDPQNCIPECLGWRLVRRSDGGAIATVTNTNLCYGVMGDGDNNGIPDDAELYGGGLAVDFFRQIAEGRYYHLGDVFKATLTNYIDIFPIRETAIHCKSIEEWILIGDPSLRIGGYP